MTSDTHTVQQKNCTVGHKSHDPCFHVFLIEAGVMTFVTHCTCCAYSRPSKFAESWSKFQWSLDVMHPRGHSEGRMCPGLVCCLKVVS